MQLLCIPNFSEGRRRGVIEHITNAARGAGVRLLHQTSDVDHDRTVLTLLGSADALVGSVQRLASAAADRLDLRQQRGVHPRLGVLDVVPFVPVGCASMTDAVQAARLAGERLSATFPVFFYERAAASEERRDLAAHRRGGLQSLRHRIADCSWPPDLGTREIDPSAGVVLVGARPPLIAFNVELASADPTAARRIARRIRQSTAGGLPGVKALGLPLPSRGRSQVSMNVVNTDRTSLFAIVERIRAEAELEGVAVLRSELIGLLGRESALVALADSLGLPELQAEHIVEQHLDPPRSGDAPKPE